MLRTRPGRNGLGPLAIDFPGDLGDDELKHLTWAEFFEEFDQRGLVFHYEDGEGSAGCKFLDADGNEE